MIRQPIKTRWRILLGLLSVVILIVAYSVMSHRQHQENPDDTTIPSWTQLKAGVVKTFEKHPRTGERWIVVDSLATGKRFFWGMFYGICGAIIIGMLMGCFSTFESFLLPPLTTIALIPPTAALAVYFVLVGTELKMYVAMISIGIGVTMARTIYQAVKDVPMELVYKAYTLGASMFEMIWNVIFKYILPKLLSSIRLHIPPAMIFLIAAEMVCGDVGFGYRIRLQSRLLNMDVVYPYLLFLALFGFLLDGGIRLLTRFLCPWYQREGK